MKIRSFIVILSLSCIILFSKCEWFLPNYYEIDYVNNADYDVYVEVIDNRGEYKNCYPDTTISFDKGMGIVKAQSYFIHTIGTLPIENYFNNIPSDTLSIFYFHPDTLAKYSWEEIQCDYKILRRYDLSIEDIKMLYNKNNVPKIPYPPTAAMKHMKMYPPYEE
jgi:hypothetical protein